MTLRGLLVRLRHNWATDGGFRFRLCSFVTFFLVLPLAYCAGFYYFGKNWTVKDGLLLGYMLSFGTALAMVALFEAGRLALEVWQHLRPSNTEARKVAKAGRLDRAAKEKHDARTAAQRRRDEAQAAFIEAADELYCQLGMNTLASTVAAHDLLETAKKKASKTR